MDRLTRPVSSDDVVRMFTPKDAERAAEAKADELLPGLLKELEAKHELRLSASKLGVSETVIGALARRFDKAGWKVSHSGWVWKSTDVTMPPHEDIDSPQDVKVRSRLRKLLEQKVAFPVFDAIDRVVPLRRRK